MRTKTHWTLRRPGGAGPRLGGGFTLIELLLVLVILTALAAVVVPKFTGRSEQAKVTAARVDISRIGGVLDAFEVDCTRYPTTEEGLGALIEAPANIQNWRGPYLQGGVPKDPWGNLYVYQCPGRTNINSYDLHSYGPDAQDGTADDITNWTQR